MVKETKVTKKYIAEMRELAVPVKGKGLLEQCSQSVVLFAEKMLGFTLYAWEIDFLYRLQLAVNGEFWTKEFLGITSRQIGKSTTVAIFSLWACTFNKYSGTLNANTIVGIVSATDTQAKKLLDEIKKLMRIGDSFMKRTYDSYKDIAFFKELLDDKQANNMSIITFKAYNADVHGEYLLKGSLNGSVIKSYPPTSSVLGETFTVVVIDEAGKTDKIDDQFFDEYCYPTGNSTDAIRIYISTPWVPSGFFYRLVDPDNIYKSDSLDKCLFTIEAIRLENPDYYKVVMKKINEDNRNGRVAEVQRAYYCRFVKGESSYFDPDRVNEVFNENEEMVEGFGKECDMGVDFGGQVKSHTVITISYLDEFDVVHRLYHKSYPVGGDLSLISDIEELMERFNVQRVVPDDCPAGDFLIRTMKEKGWDVHPMNFRSEKVKKYGAFRKMVNTNTMLSYVDDELRTEMLALEYGAGKRNSVITAPSGYTDDLIDSWVLSTYFFLQDETDFKIYDWDDVE